MDLDVFAEDGGELLLEGGSHVQQEDKIVLDYIF